MKKTLIALAVLGTVAGAVQAQSSITIYGIVDTGVAYTNKTLLPGTKSGATGSKVSLNSGIVQGSRLGFKGVEDLGGDLKALFQLETGFNNDTGALQGDKGSTNLFRRKAVVGLGGSLGTVLLGRQTDILDDIGGQWTSVLDFGTFVAAPGHVLDRLEGTRTNNSIRYNTPNLAGFTASAIYGFGEAAGSTTGGQSFGFGSQYVNGPLALFAAYYQSKLGHTLNGTMSDTSLINTAPAFVGSPDATALKTFSLGSSYQIGPARVYGNWSRTRQPLATVTPNNVIGGLSNDKADVFELGVNYAITAPLQLVASVQHTSLDFIGASRGTLNQFNLGTHYFLSKRTDVYAFVSELRATNTTNPGILGDTTGTIGNQTAFAVGVRHKF